MSYLDVISLAEAKTHLGVDDTSRDAEITRMISTCLSKVESDTNNHVIAKDKVFVLDEGNCALVYDFPINTAVSGTVSRSVKYTYSIYYDSDTDNDDLTLNVGYTDPADVPEGLKDLALILLEQLFHKGEMKMTDEYKFLSGQFRRFII